VEATSNKRETLLDALAGCVIPLPPVYARSATESVDCRAVALAKADLLHLTTSTQRATTRLGSAPSLPAVCGSRALAKPSRVRELFPIQDCFGETPKRTPETRTRRAGWASSPIHRNPRLYSKKRKCRSRMLSGPAFSRCSAAKTELCVTVVSL